jgi:hypothetical protein
MNINAMGFGVAHVRLTRAQLTDVHGLVHSTANVCGKLEDPAIRFLLEALEPSRYFPEEDDGVRLGMEALS